MILEQKRSLGLVLSGGTARGLAHIGVLEVLEENHIPIDCIVATSMGALVGGIYSAGKLKEFKDDVIKLSNSKIQSLFLAMKLRKMNTDSERAIGPYLHKFIQDKKIEDLGIDYTAVATDLRTGKEVFINKGSLEKAILASICLPGVFHPIMINKQLLVDGGVVDPIPQKYAHTLAEKVIVINAIPEKISYKKHGEGIFDVLSDAAGIMSNTLINMENIINLRSIEPNKFIFIQLKTEKWNPFDFHLAPEIIELGRTTAEKHIKEIIEFSKMK